MEGADDLPPDDEGDAAGPAALLRAAAELIVDAAERGRTLAGRGRSASPGAGAAVARGVGRSESSES